MINWTPVMAEITPTPIKGMELPDKEALSTLSKMVHRQVDLEKTVERLKEETKQAEKDLREVSDDQIPQEMLSLGLSALVLEDGSKLSIKDVYSASIPKYRNKEAIQWLRDHEHDGMIKSLVSLSFGREEQELRSKVFKQLKASGFSPEETDSVHSGTLKAWVKECEENGIKIPHDLFGVYVGKRANIKQ